MRTIRSLAFLAALLPTIATAQQTLPANSVWGRLGIGSGPPEAIPFALLSSKMTGVAITLNSGNGQTAPGGMSGGNTYSFGATTDMPQFAGIGLGGTAPATGLKVYNAAVNPGAGGQGSVGASSTNGAGLIGQGSIYDSYLGNNAGNPALGVNTGTQNVTLLGTLTAAYLQTTGTIAGSLCATSGGAILYEAGVNCYAVSGISVASGKTLTINNSLTLNGTDGTTFTLPSSSGTLAGLGTNQAFTGTDTFSGTLNITGTGQLNGTPFGTFATQNYATPPAIGGTTPNTGAFSTLTATTPIGLTSGGTNASTAQGARAAAALNIDELTSKGDTNYTILATDRTVGTSAALTAPRTWTLPAASSVNPGQHLIVQDFVGGVSNTNTLTISRAGTDTINGSATSIILNSANGGYLLISNGVSNWSAQALGAQASAGVASINGQTGNPSILPGTGMSVTTTGGNITVATTEPVRSVKNDYNAVCDGSADDTTAIQNAVAAANTGNFALQISGTCLVTGLIPNLHSGNITWVGSGAIKHSGANPFYPNPTLSAGTNTIYLSNSGNDNNDGLSPSTAIGNIQQFFTIVARYQQKYGCSNWSGVLAAGNYAGATMPTGLSLCAPTNTANPTDGHIQLNGPQPSGSLGDNVTPTAFIDGNYGPAGQTYGLGLNGFNSLYLTNVYVRNWNLECIYATPFSDVVMYNVWLAGCGSYGVSSRQSHITMYGGTIDGSTSTAPGGIQNGLSLLNSTVFTVSSVNQTLAKGTVIKNTSQVGVLAQEGSTGHLDYATVTANAGVGVYLAEHAHAQLTSTSVTNNTTAGLQIDTSSTWLNSSSTISGNGNGNLALPVQNTTAPWNSYTPTVTCGTGSLTSYTVTGAYQKFFGNTTGVKVQLTVTTVGTCAGVVTITLPATAADYAIAEGQEVSNTGFAWTGKISSGTSNMTLARYDNTNTLANGMSLVFSGVYQNQ